MADIKDKRSVIFLGHSSAGKTSLIDAILYKTGANTRHGNVIRETACAITMKMR